MLHRDLPTAFVDLETTGARPGYHRITEIAIVQAGPDGAVSEWSSLINPGREIPLAISALTGIHDEMVADAPYFEDLWQEIRARLDGHVFAAHNVRFDYGFLRHAFAAVGHRFRPQRVCTVRLSRALYPGRREHNLDALVRRHHLTCEPRHRALTDARAIWEFCVKAGAELGAATVRAAAGRQLAGPPLPPGLDRDQLDDLSDGPGVYLFKGSDDALLYVGKSVTLRSRVRAHLAEAARGGRGQKMVALLRAVEAIETAGELGALLLEAELIKRRAPVFNRRLRRHAQAWTIAMAENEDGLAVPRIVPIEAGASDVHYGCYRHEAAARRRLKALGETGLCRKALGLETGPGSCFAWQLQRCRGVCAGREPPVAHNLRLLEALGGDRVPDWPFPGPVAVTERAGGRTQHHVLDRWCHLGSAATRRDVPELLDGEAAFDLDVYRILARYLSRHAARLELTHL